MKRALCFDCLFLLCFLQTVCCYSGETGQIPSFADLIWVEHRGSVSTVLHSEAHDGRWTDPDQVTVSVSDRISTPSVLRDKRNQLWAFWSVVRGDMSLLYVSRSADGHWSAPELVPTGMVFAGGACPIVDKENQLWLFWVGNDGASDDDIFSSRWNGTTWSKPVRINRGNNSPDIFPVAGLNGSGMPWIVWSGFTGSSYQRFFSEWTGNQWQKQQLLTKNNAVFKALRERFARIIKLPGSATLDRFAYINIHDSENSLNGFRLIPQK